MPLKIQQNWAQVGLNSELAHLKLKNKLPKVEVERSHPQVKLEQELVRVECDATQCRAEVGILTIAAFTRKNAQSGLRNSYEYMAQAAQYGDMLASVEKFSSGDCMTAYAAQAWETKEFVFNRAPQSLVDVTVIPNSLKISWQMGDVQTGLIRGAIQNNSTSSQLEVYLRQKASIDVSFVGSAVDAYR